jgi:transposase InsO family protein
LTVIDEGTRYPEAFPLPSIEAERIAQSLVQLFSRVGVARVILSDQGSNFTSTLLKQYEMLGVKGITTSLYRPQSNGKCERYNGTLKKVLKKLCITYEKDWDEMLSYALFAYRETPHEET